MLLIEKNRIHVYALELSEKYLKIPKFVLYSTLVNASPLEKYVTGILFIKINTTRVLQWQDLHYIMIAKHF